MLSRGNLELHRSAPVPRPERYLAPVDRCGPPGIMEGRSLDCRRCSGPDEELLSCRSNARLLDLDPAIQADEPFGTKRRPHVHPPRLVLFASGSVDSLLGDRARGIVPVVEREITL